MFASYLTDIEQLLDAHARVSHWYACLPNAIFVFTEMSAHELAKDLQNRFHTGAGRRFLVTELSANRQGRLPKELWDLLRDPSRIMSGSQAGRK